MSTLTLTCPLDGLALTVVAVTTDPLHTISRASGVDLLTLAVGDHVHLVVDARGRCANGHGWQLDAPRGLILERTT
jgi:hypothetical protein